MTQSTLNLIFHPVRIRVLMLLNRHAPATASQLATLLPDVNPRTLYRHLNELLDGEMIRIVDTQRVRGAVERYYELSRPAVLNVDELNNLTPEEGKQLFIYLVSMMQAEFSAFLDASQKPHALADSHVRIGELIATPSQMHALFSDMLARAAELETAPAADETSQSYRFSLIAFPLLATMD